jgi:hypothetical protein
MQPWPTPLSQARFWTGLVHNAYKLNLKGESMRKVMQPSTANSD